MPMASRRYHILVIFYALLYASIVILQSLLTIGLCICMQTMQRLPIIVYLDERNPVLTANNNMTSIVRIVSFAKFNYIFLQGLQISAVYIQFVFRHCMAI